MTAGGEPPEDDDGRGPRLSRRAVVGILAGAGAFAVAGAGETAFGAGGGTVLGIGGGSMADAAQEHRVKVYYGPLADRPSAGVKNRVWKVENDPDPAKNGAIYYDNGTAWTLPSIGSQANPVPAVTTEALGTETPPKSTHYQSGAIPPLMQMRSLIQSGHKRQQKTVVAWSFDDGYQSVYDNRSVFTGESVPAAVAYIPDPKPGASVSDTMSWSELSELNEQHGWQVMQHGERGFKFTTDLSDDEASIEDEVYNGLKAHFDAAQEQNNPELIPTHFVYSGGQVGGEVGRGVVADIYGVAWKASGGIINFGHSNDHIGDYGLSRFSTDGGEAISNIKSEVDDAVTNNTGLVLYGHDLISGDVGDEGALQTSTGKVSEIITYVKNKAGAEWGRHMMFGSTQGRRRYSAGRTEGSSGRRIRSY